MSEEKPPVPQLYREEHVLTTNDLIGVRNGYVLQYLQTPSWHLWRRLKFQLGVGVIDSLMIYLRDGKVAKTTQE